MSDRPRLPIPPGRVSPDNAEFHAALDEGRLLLPRCEACGQVIWYPRHHCPDCGSGRVSWFEASGRGTVYSFTVVRRGQGAYAELGPFFLAYVELEEGPRVLTNLVDDPADAGVEVGDAVVATVERGSEGVPPLLRFRLSRAGKDQLEHAAPGG